jgi:cyanate permease
MSTVSMVGGLLSPWFAGRVYDMTGSYHNAWMIIAVATLPAVLLIALAKPPIAARK